MLHERAGFGALGVARIGIFGLWLLVVATTPLHLLAELPAVMQSPPGILEQIPERFWKTFLAPAPLTVFRCGLALLLLFVILGARPFRPLALLTAAGILLFDGTLKSYGGFINHAQFASLYCAILLSLAPSGQGLQLQVRCEYPRGAVPAPKMNSSSVNPGSVLRLGGLLIAVPYTLIGLHRLAAGGLAIFTDDSLPVFVMLRTFESSGYAFQLGYLAAGSAGSILLLKLGFVVTTLAEVASPFALFHRTVRWGWMGIMVPFHFATLFTMSIFFWENLILLALFFTDLPTWIEERFARAGRPPVIVSAA